MDMETKFGKDVEKEMMEEEISEEETKIDLNEENRDMIDKEKKFIYTLKVDLKKKRRRKKKTKEKEKKIKKRR